MNFHVMTLFPDMIREAMNTSIIKRAMDAGKIGLDAVDIRDYTANKHNRVDDYTYGGGAGMLMQAQPVYDCYKAITKDLPGDVPVIYVSPQGRVFDQKMAFANYHPIWHKPRHTPCR